MGSGIGKSCGRSAEPLVVQATILNERSSGKRRSEERSHPLFISQGGERIEFGGAVSRQETGEGSDNRQADDRDHQREGIARLQAEEEGFGRLCGGKGQG